MSPSRTIGIILGWTALGVALGAVVALLLPKQYVSVAELAVESDALAWAGLARFDRLNIADGVEVETLVQLLKSARLSNATAAQVGGVSRYEIEKSLKVVYEKSSPVVTLKVTSGAPAQAQAIGRVLIENVVKIDGEKKQQRSREAIEAVKAQTAEVERQLGALNGEIQKFAATRTVALSNDPERQRRAATELAYLTEKLAMLNVEGATLRERGRRLAELMAALPAVSAAPPGFAVEEADKSPGLAEARTRLLAQELKFAMGNIRKKCNGGN